MVKLMVNFDKFDKVDKMIRNLNLPKQTCVNKVVAKSVSERKKMKSRK